MLKVAFTTVFVRNSNISVLYYTWMIFLQKRGSVKTNDEVCITNRTSLRISQHYRKVFDFIIKAKSPIIYRAFQTVFLYFSQHLNYMQLICIIYYFLNKFFQLTLLAISSSRSLISIRCCSILSR
jgi:hypothetical protein